MKTCARLRNVKTSGGQNYSHTVQIASPMQSISVNSLNMVPAMLSAPTSLAGSGIQPLPTAPSTPAEATVSASEPTVWDNLYNFGDSQRAMGNSFGGFASDVTYNMFNDTYTGYNWIMNRETNDLRGLPVGYNHALQSATFLWSSILSLPFSFIGKGVEGGSEIVQTTTRVGKNGNAVEVLLKNGNKIDINAARVKGWVPNLHPNAPAGTLQKVKFPNAIPGSKGFKRLPTQEELEFLNSFFK